MYYFLTELLKSGGMAFLIPVPNVLSRDFLPLSSSGQNTESCSLHLSLPKNLLLSNAASHSDVMLPHMILLDP